jgi:phosphoribosylformylglycinamidine cyclo-ligase
VPDKDMKKTFNMGIGYIIIVDEKKKNRTIEILRKNGFSSHHIGTIERGIEGVSYAKD